MPVVKCQKCAKEFKAKNYWLKKGFGKFCSSGCQYSAARHGKEVPCDICGSVIYKQRKAIQGSKSGKFFCSKTCQTKWRNQLYIGELHKNFKTGVSGYRGVLERNNVPKVCRLCSTTDERVIIAHHIDKDRSNNALKNLAWLCNNCHFLVHHYEGEYKKFMATIV